jgi:hypothetical protein
LKNTRIILGLILIITAIAGLIFWEAKGREALLLDTVIVASKTIKAGTAITKDHLACSGIPSANRIYNSLDWEMVPDILGRVAVQDIVANAQLSKEYLGDEDFLLKGNQSLYVLHSDWIAMRSSSLRRGDWVEIFEKEGLKKIGIYKVAFVKDANEVEVVDGTEGCESDPLKRLVSTSPVNHIEIITNIEEYKKMLDCISNGDNGLLVIQKGGWS